MLYSGGNKSNLTCGGSTTSAGAKQVKLFQDGQDISSDSENIYHLVAVEPDQPAGRMLSGDQGCLHPSLRHQPDLHDGVLRKVQGFAVACSMVWSYVELCHDIHKVKAGCLCVFKKLSESRATTQL